MQTLRWVSGVFLLLCLACNSESPSTQEESSPDQKRDSTIIKDPDAKPKTAEVLGERIKGLSAVREEPDGRPLFVLFDGARIETTSGEKGWMAIAILFDLDVDPDQKKTWQRGDKLFQNGREVGEILDEIPVEYFGNESQDMVGYLDGYVPTHFADSNTVPEIIIKNLLLQQDGKINSGQLKALQRIPKLEEFDQFAPYEGLSFYESWLVDPSAGFRMLFLLEKDILKAIVHSREIDLNSGHSQKLERDYMIWFPDFIEKPEQETISSIFNDWIVQVD